MSGWFRLHNHPLMPMSGRYRFVIMRSDRNDGVAGGLRIAQSLVSLASEQNGQGACSIEVVSVGACPEPGKTWVIVLYRHLDVRDAAQTIGYGFIVDEAQLLGPSAESCSAIARRFWSDVFEEPPGGAIDKQTLGRSIAWWRWVSNWDPRTGPPGSVERAVKVFRLNQSPDFRLPVPPSDED